MFYSIIIAGQWREIFWNAPAKQAVYARCELDWWAWENRTCSRKIPQPASYTDKQLLAEKTTTEAQLSMQKAANEVKTVQGRDIRFLVDRTWKQCGFCEQGVVTLLSNLIQNESNKVIDTEVSSMFCHTCCLQWKKSTHAKNHDGPAGSIEVADAVRIFGRSKDQYGL